MIKIIIFISVMLNCFALDGKIRLIGGVSNNFYKNNVKYSVFPFWSLNYKKINITGLNISTQFSYKGLLFDIACEPGLTETLLNRGDLEGKILHDRDIPLLLELKVNKTINRFSVSGSYKKDFASGGNLLGCGFSYLYFFNKKYNVILIPNLLYLYKDNQYQSYDTFL